MLLDRAPSKSGLASTILRGQKRILEILVERDGIEDVLSDVCRVIDEYVEGASCAILSHERLTDDLRFGAGPRIPAALREAMDRVPVGPVGTSSSAAVHYGKTVVVEDIADNSIWLDLRDVAIAAGYRSCWSVPLRRARADSRGERRVVGTLDFFFPEVTPFSEERLETLEAASELAAFVVHNTHTRVSLYQRQHYDALTDLPNRSLFSNRLKNLIADARASRQERRFAVMVLDLDNFKEVNDTLGFLVGDLLLQAVGSRLSSCLEDHDTIARSGGDDFLLLLQIDDEEMSETCSQLLRRINEPHYCNGDPLFTTASLGVSVFPWDGEDAQTLLGNAETALAAAKERGGSSYELFRPTMSKNNPTVERWFQQTRLSSQLRGVLLRDELEMHYQLKVGRDRKSYAGAEALVRWRHPELGLLAPNQFIPLAERMGLTVPFGDWSLREACRQIRVWQSAGLLEIPLSINVSPLQFRHGRFVETLEEVLRTTCVNPELIELEIVERLAMEDTASNQNRLKRLHDLGIRLSIDDFGTGFSSLSYLARFPFDTIKIDRSFVKEIGSGTERDSDNRNIIAAIVSLAHALSIEVVAEGVETEEQADFLWESGCDVIQGFYYARPVPPGEIATLLAARSA